jgi:hypothetical protein
LPAVWAGHLLGIASPDPRAIIMAGFDYQGGGVDFGQSALRRWKLLIAATPRLSVTNMNVGAGTTTVSAMTPNAKGVPVRTEAITSTHRTVTAANYSTGLQHHARFDTDQAGRMSIIDLYAAVQDIGSDPDTAGSLTEVSVFSHGFFDGPILVNSDDSNPWGAVQPEHVDQLDGPVSNRIELLRQDCPAAWCIAEALPLPFPALVIACDMYVKAHIRAELEEQVLDLRVGRGGRQITDTMGQWPARRRA